MITALRQLGLIETLCFKSTIDIDKSWTFNSRFNFYIDTTYTYYVNNNK